MSAAEQVLTRRIFFALWPDHDTQLRLARLQDLVRNRQVRRTHPEDIHLTLQFLGAVPQEKLPCIQQAGEGLDIPSFELILNHLGCWSRPRVAWAAPDETPEPLSLLVKHLGERLAPCGYPPERRKYRPHVTLMRKIRSLPRIDLEEPLVWRADRVALVSSMTVPEPPRYRVLKSWDLPIG